MHLIPIGLPIGPFWGFHPPIGSADTTQRPPRTGPPRRFQGPRPPATACVRATYRAHPPKRVRACVPCIRCGGSGAHEAGSSYPSKRTGPIETRNWGYHFELHVAT